MLPATRNRFTTAPIASVQKRRVAAYARVSTDSDEQLTSYEAQVDYYTQYIQERPEWVFAGIYTDEGISGTNTKRREGFNQMIADALAGKIDLIVTKSVSRFARNTVDSLTTVRKLREKGVEIFFRRRISTHWIPRANCSSRSCPASHRKRAAASRRTSPGANASASRTARCPCPTNTFSATARAKTASRRSCRRKRKWCGGSTRLLLEGQTPYGIKRVLEEEPYPYTRRKGNVADGDDFEASSRTRSTRATRFLQKTFCTDFLTKKMKINEGEVPQYYVENSHPAIVAPEVFDLVQEELERRKQSGKAHRGTSCFAGKLVCGCCGGLYGSKVWHSTDQYPPCHLAVQRQIQGKGKVRYATPDRRDDPAEIPHRLQ